MKTEPTVTITSREYSSTVVSQVAKALHSLNDMIGRVQVDDYIKRIETIESLAKKAGEAVSASTGTENQADIWSPITGILVALKLELRDKLAKNKTFEHDFEAEISLDDYFADLCNVTAKISRVVSQIKQEALDDAGKHYKLKQKADGTLIATPRTFEAQAQ